MLTLTFVRLVDLVAILNINGSYYNTTIIKIKKNMAYQHKVIFCIRDGFGYEFGVGSYVLVTRVLKSRKTQTHTQTQSKRGKSVKSGLVRAGNHGYGFCCHA